MQGCPHLQQSPRLLSRQCPHTPGRTSWHSTDVGCKTRTGWSRRQLTVCMATPRRQLRVAKQIEREVGALFVTDQTLQAAVAPNRAEDDIDAALASVTEVQISGDLQVAKVYVSISGSEEGQEAAMEGLTRLKGYVRRHIAKAVRLRFVPEIRFFLDDSLEQDEQLLAAFERARLQAAGELEPPPIVIRGGYLGTHANQNVNAELPPILLAESQASEEGQSSDSEAEEPLPTPDLNPQSDFTLQRDYDLQASKHNSDAQPSANELANDSKEAQDSRLIDKLEALGFFGEDEDDDDDDFEFGYDQEEQKGPTSPRGRKKLKSVGRRRHLGKSKGR